MKKKRRWSDRRSAGKLQAAGRPMTIWRFLLLGFLLSLVGRQPAIGQTVAGQAPNLDSSRLRGIVEAGAQEAHTAAVVFGVWVGQREVVTGALGNSTTTQPATTDMHYRIGGIAETFMSTLLLMLAEQGRIDLDDTIARWLPHLLAADRVTVRMLVGNTAGYIDYVTEDDFGKAQLADPFRTFTDDELIDYSVRNGKMNFAPGTSQRYSHTDNVILGQVIQRATGQSIERLYQDNIFGPMGMRDTQAPVGQDVQAPVLHAFTSERHVYEDCTYWNLRQMGCDPRHGTVGLAGPLPGADRPDIGRQRTKSLRSLLCLWVCLRKWLDPAEPQYQWL